MERPSPKKAKTFDATAVSSSYVPSTSTSTSTSMSSLHPHALFQSNGTTAANGRHMIHSMIHENLKNDRPISSNSVNSYSSHFDLKEEKSSRKPQDKRISELLAENLTTKLTISRPVVGSRRMEGDIPDLILHSSFFVEGVKIGWAFPAIMPPQRQMALHLIKALKNRRHVVLESPTGTGKSAAILCSVLAWQRYHQRILQEMRDQHPPPASASADNALKAPTIIYCSRTHSQVAQMVKSLKGTPYRPRMAVLGSRDRMCIHKALVDPNNKKQSGTINQECRSRVTNTDRHRKVMYNSPHTHYDDDNPPEDLDQDHILSSAEEEDTTTMTTTKKPKKPCCPHYRQLGPRRTAELTIQQLIPPAHRVDCCTIGGNQTKMGLHDIEDLVKFAKDPYRIRGVAIYRKRGSREKFGMQLDGGEKANGRSNPNRLIVHTIAKSSPAQAEGTIRPRDEVLAINGVSVRGETFDDAVERIGNTKDEPLMLDITHEPAMVERNPDDDASLHAPCPYYLSRNLARHAEIIFAPYNYVLDPFIRKTFDISLNNKVVVLDEAHNVEGTLRESGSGKFGEFELCEMVAMLQHLASANVIQKVSVPADTSDGVHGAGGDEKKDISQVTHDLVLFLEKIIFFLLSSKSNFECHPNGAQKAISEWRRFHTPDTTEFDMTYDGPTGNGVNRRAVGCRPFFDRIQQLPGDMDRLVQLGESLDSHIRPSQEERSWHYFGILDRMNQLLSLFSIAAKNAEHYYIASVARANGSLDFAAGNQNSQFPGAKRKPQQLPFVFPRKKEAPSLDVHACRHPQCRALKDGPSFVRGAIRHGDYCNGQTPPWEAVLVLELLTPSCFMKHLRDECHTVVLASGSLAPIPSLCAELGLHDDSPISSTNGVGEDAKTPFPGMTDVFGGSSAEKKIGRLQTRPKPLEADHVISLEKQLLAVSIGFFEDGQPLTVTYSNWSKPDFIPRLGKAIATVVESIPTGGVLVFLPSYSFLRKCSESWKRPTRGEESVWSRLVFAKGEVIAEPTGGQEKFELARDKYAQTIDQTGNCVLLAVFRGKMSEGISFNDAHARGVICVGLPYPNSFDKAVKAKMSYNDEQRKLQHRTEILPGSEWYSQQAYRAIAQALGRCIRHASDYGTVVLMDSRHCDDGAPSTEKVCYAHRKLPKWMRHHVRNLSRYSHDNSMTKSICGGWNGLQQEMRRFFSEAPGYAAAVKSKEEETLRRARSQNTPIHTFNTATGDWTPQKPQPETISSSKSKIPLSSSSATRMITPMTLSPVVIDLSSPQAVKDEKR